jgi:anti-sigma factor RsiW
MNTLATLHPDYLLDRARRGELPPDERRRLAAHLAGCPACAWEQAAADDFSRATRAFDDAEKLDPARLDALVDGALARAGVTTAAPTRAAAPHSAAGPRPRALARKVAAAAMIAAAVAAVLLPSARAARDGARDTASVASTEAGLDAGAIGAPSGGDS